VRKIDAHHLHGTLFGGFGQPPDQRDVGIGADTPDMEGRNSIVPDWRERIEEQDAVPKIAAILGRLDLRQTRRRFDPALADPFERLGEAGGTRRYPRLRPRMISPRRALGIDLADADLVEKIGEAVRIGRVRTIPLGAPDRSAFMVGEGEEARPRPPPHRRPFVTPFLLLLQPPDGTAGHLLIDAVLPGRDHVGEQRQRLALAPLLCGEGGTLARGLLIDAGPGPFGEAHHAPPFAAAAARMRMRSPSISEPARQAASA
jgi:hypothetical protein